MRRSQTRLRANSQQPSFPYHAKYVIKFSNMASTIATVYIKNSLQRWSRILGQVDDKLHVDIQYIGARRARALWQREDRKEMGAFIEREVWGWLRLAWRI